MHIASYPTFLLIAISLPCYAFGQTDGSRTPNIVFVMFDDLRGDFKEVGAKTPHLDRLASQSVTFRNAYAASPACGVSRSSLFSGLQPTMTRFLRWNARVDTDTPDVVTIPDRLKAAGYVTVSNGKVYHDPTDDRDGWTEDAKLRPTGKSWWPGQRPGEPDHFRTWQNRSPKNRRTGLGPAYERGAGVDDSFYGEGVVVDKSIEDIQQIANKDKPFFLAVGFHRPHLPFIAPDRYWEMYRADEIQRLNLQIETHRARAPNVSRRFYHNWYEIKSYGGIPARLDKIRNNQELEQTLVHAYLAAVSYSDAQMGRLFASLRDPNGDGNQEDSVWDDTLIVAVSDHGFHLGENDLWAKARLWEIGLDSLLMVKPAHTQKAAVGKSSDTLVSLLDIYPTVCEAIGDTRSADRPGTSLWPLVANPSFDSDRPVISRFRTDDSIRTKQYRYTESSTPDGKVVARSLFDLQRDPHETTNLADAQPTVVAELSRKLAAGWQKADFSAPPSHSTATTR